MTDFNKNPYVLVWNNDYKKSKVFSDISEALSAFNEDILSKGWNESNIKDILYLKKYMSVGYLNSDFEVFDSIYIAVGKSSFRHRLPKTDIQKCEKLYALNVYANATKGCYTNGKSIREILQGIVNGTYYVSILNSGMVAE